MILVRRPDVGGQELYVCDRLLPKRAVLDHDEYFRKKAYLRMAKAMPGSSVSYWVTLIDEKELEGTLLYDRTLEAVERCFPGPAWKLYRAYCNNLGYGDQPFIHRDIPLGSEDVTAVYYVNAKWLPEWGGETIFYGEDRDAAAAVSPRPGRLVVSRASLLHTAGIPLRDCHERRMTVVMSFAPKKRR